MHLRYIGFGKEEFDAVKNYFTEKGHTVDDATMNRMIDDLPKTAVIIYNLDALAAGNTAIKHNPMSLQKAGYSLTHIYLSSNGFSKSQEKQGICLKKPISLEDLANKVPQ